MGLFSGAEKLVKKGIGLLSGGEARPIGEMGNKKELADILKRQMESAKTGKIAREEGKLATEQALAATTSAIKGSKGLSAGLKQRQIAGEGRKVLSHGAAGQMISALKEQQQGLRDAASTALGQRGQQLQREGLISEADQDKRARRQKAVGALFQGFGDMAKGGQ